MVLHLILCAILFSDTDSLQDFQYRFHPFSHDQRLSGENVRSLFQDSHGFIWYGSDSEGLCKYVGSELEVFSHIGRDSTTISSNYINDINEDEYGNIWLATDKGLNVFTRDSRRFEKIPLSSKRFNVCNVLYRDAEGTMWLGTDGGLVRFSVSKSTGRIPAHKADVIREFVGLSVTSIVQDRDHSYWIGTKSGLFNLAIPDHRVRHWTDTGGQHGLSDNEINAILQLDGDFLLIGTDNGVNLFDQKKDQFHRLEFRESGVFNQAKVGIVDLFRDFKGVVWIGTSSYGILTGKPTLENNGELPCSFNLPNRVTGVTSDNITGFIEDASGQVWVTTKFGGICIYDRRNELFPRFSLPHDQDVGYNHIIAALEDQQGRFWFGTRNRGLLTYSPDSGAFEEVPVYQGVDEVRRIEAISQTADGYIWLGHKKGMNYLDPITYEQEYYELPKVFSVKEDKQENLWIGTIAGVFFRSSQSSRIGRYKSHHSFFRNAEVEIDNIYLDSRESVWFGTNNLGAFRYFPGNDSLIHFAHSASSSGTISGNTIRSILEDTHGNIWIGTKSSGLNRFDGERHFTHYRKSDGLPSNSIFSILDDKQGYLWLVTNNGISKFHPGKVQFVNFNKNHGLQDDVFEKKACLVTRKGELLVAGNNGFNLFDPQKVSLQDFTPGLVITSIKANGRLLQKDVFSRDTFRIPYDENMISFEFSSLDYRDKTAIKYAYKLEGLDESWIYTEDQNAVTYSNLSPGAYHFRFIATNADGVWSVAEQGTTIVVGKPFWLEWWAYLIYLLLMCLVLFLIYRIATVRAGYFHQLASKELELKRTREMHQLKLNFFTNISHELRTPLTLIMASIEKLMKSQIDAPINKSVKAAHRCAKQLLNLTDQLLYFRKVEQGNLPLKVSRGDLKKYIEDLILPFEQLAAKEDITLLFSSGECCTQTWFDADKIEKIISNLLVNAFKYTPPGGVISLSCKWNDFSAHSIHFAFLKGADYLKISVKDNGRGMTDGQLEHIFDRYYQTDIMNTGGGIGLDLVKGLVKLHKGEIQVKSQPGKGSEFIVFLPVSRSAFDEREIKSGGDIRKRTTAELLTDFPLEPDMPMQLLENENDQHSEPGTRYKLLIAEDNRDLIAFLRETLSKDFFISIARNGKQALEEVGRFHPDIVLSDVMMPELDGIELCRRLKKDTLTSHVPVVLLTARVLEEQQVEGFDSGADAYVTKPFNAHVLTHRLKSLIKNRRTVFQKISGGAVGVVRNVSSGHPSDDHFLQRINQIISENYQKVGFSVEEFAYDLHMSRSQLFRKIKALAGQTPSEYLYAYRIRQAMNLLGSGDMTIAEVAYQTGFKSPNSFSKTFTKHVGRSPRAYAAESHPGLLWEKK